MMRPTGFFWRYFFSILLIGIGIGLILDNFNLIHIDLRDLFMKFWPAIILLFGVKLIADALLWKRHAGGWLGSLFFGFIIAVIGWNLLAERIGLYEIVWSNLWGLIWPLFLIFIGFRLLIRPSSPEGKRGIHIEVKHHSNEKEFGREKEDLHTRERDQEEKEDKGFSRLKGLFESEGFYTEGKEKKKKYYKSALIGDIGLGKELFELEDMHLWNGIGDVNIDFSKAKIGEGETEVEIRGWVGDVKLYIPRELPVSIWAHLGVGDYRIFDDYDNGTGRHYVYQSPNYEEAPKRLRLLIDLKIGGIRILDV